MNALAGHEHSMLTRLENGLRGTRLHGSPDRDRTPTVLFSVEGVAPDEVYRRLAERDVNAPAGTFYALECARWLGVGDAGAVRAGIAPYTNADDVDRLIDAAQDLLHKTTS
jgi:selenocysteine lyase/cysteine desulfurase